ncbi:MAG TPA: c-type cytochrome [Rhizomicrobium sp.]|jgi:mono/diheme cytochrome c family protein|nr:c-type cytochrome [Rhizomicrobium sp.]
MDRLFTLNVLAIASLFLGVASTAWAQDAPKGDAGNGRKVYLADGCYQCHGRVGQGGSMNGAAPILAQTRMSFPAFRNQIRNPVNDMPAYSESMLSDKDLADIFAFVLSLPGRRPVSEFPILNN